MNTTPAVITVRTRDNIVVIHAAGAARDGELRLTSGAALELADDITRAAEKLRWQERNRP